MDHRVESRNQCQNSHHCGSVHKSPAVDTGLSPIVDDGTSHVAFGIPPQVRFKGQPGEQATMFFRDPSGNALEFKAFASDDMLFATETAA